MGDLLKTDGCVGSNTQIHRGLLIAQGARVKAGGGTKMNHGIEIAAVGAGVMVVVRPQIDLPGIDAIVRIAIGDVLLDGAHPGITGGGDGPKPLDLDSGVVELVMPSKQDDPEDQG